MSLLSWERGLKYIRVYVYIPPVVVAPLVGAWIEIVMRQRISYRLGSLLSWERGLK